MPERIDADVCVIGAGYAGLTAARRLTQGGKSVVVLEARGRVGGRIWTHHLADGSPVDRGGAWLAPGHDAILPLAQEVGVSTYKTWVKGTHLLVDGQRTRRYTGLIPKISPLVTLDATPAAGRPGVIASFTLGPVADRVGVLDEAERRHLVLDALSAKLGPTAASPSEIIETTWWTERWTRGCSMAHFPPGTLTRYGPLLRESLGRVHWAGTETSTTSHGARIDGAVRSGERAAAEILAQA